MNIKTQYNNFRLLRENHEIDTQYFFDFLKKNRITIQQNQFELGLIFNLLNKRKPFRSYMEIGVFQGASVLFFSLILENKSNILLCDSLQAKNSDKSNIQFACELLKKDHKVSTFFNKSRYLNKNNKYKCKYDLCLIDGRHRLFNVIYDLFIVSRITNSKGVIMLHDINNYKTNIPFLWKCIKPFFDTDQIISKKGPNGEFGLIFKI